MLVQEYHVKNGEWPTSFKDMTGLMSEANVSPRSYSGGANNWIFEKQTDGSLFLIYIGEAPCEQSDLRFKAMPQLHRDGKNTTTQ
jgi:hypothetical protein